MSQKDETFNSKDVNYRIKSTDSLEILMFHCIVIKLFANSFQCKLYTLKATFQCNVLILQPVSRKECHEFPLTYQLDTNWRTQFEHWWTSLSIDEPVWHWWTGLSIDEHLSWIWCSSMLIWHWWTVNSFTFTVEKRFDYKNQLIYDTNYNMYGKKKVWQKKMWKNK